MPAEGWQQRCGSRGVAAEVWQQRCGGRGGVATEEVWQQRYGRSYFERDGYLKWENTAGGSL